MKLRVSIVLIWAALVALLVSRSLLIPEIDRDAPAALAQAREESFYGIWSQNQRIGTVENHFHPKPAGGFFLDQQARFQLNILNQSQRIDLHLTADLDRRQRLHAFSLSFRAPFYSLDARGTVTGHTLSLVIDSGGDRRRETIALSEAPFLETQFRAYLLNPLPALGHRVKISFFDPLSLSRRETVVEYLGKQKILIKKRVVRLHHFRAHFSGIQIQFWLDEKGKVIKETSPAGFVFLAEPKFKARDIQAPRQELLRAVAVPFTGTFPSVKTPGEVVYRLRLPSGVPLDLNGGRQVFKNGDLRVTREDLPLDAVSEKNHSECGAPEAMQPGRFIESTHKEIVARAEAITGNEQSRLAKVRRLTAWIYTHIDKRPVIGLPDALATLHSRRGDCNEHAVLFAALARASRVPTRIVSGVVLYRQRFYYHAWNESCIDGRWISVDSTRNQLPADLTHIRLVIGNLAEQVRIGALLGKLSITILPVKSDEQTGN